MTQQGTLGQMKCIQSGKMGSGSSESDAFRPGAVPSSAPDSFLRPAPSIKELKVSMMLGGATCVAGAIAAGILAAS